MPKAIPEGTGQEMCLPLFHKEANTYLFLVFIYG
jgi:hypothetical protein